MTTASWACGRIAFATPRTLCALPRRSTHTRTKSDSKQSTSERTSKSSEQQRDLLVDILSANATKRDAKQYLSRFNGSKNDNRPSCPSVNLGSLYTPTRAIADSPQFIRSAQLQPEPETRDQLHASLISIRGSELISDETIEGLALTVAQLGKLDLRVVLVVAPGDQTSDLSGLHMQAERLAEAISRHSRHGARVIDQAITKDDQAVSMLSSKILRNPLVHGIVAVVPTIVYDTEGSPSIATLHDTMEVLSNDLVDPSSADQISLDRIVLVDRHGGIPSRARQDGAHLFINLNQEHDAILRELQEIESSSLAPHHKHAVGVHIDNLQIARSILGKLPAASSALIINPEEAASSSARKSDDTYTIGAGTRRKRNTLIHNLLTNKPLVSSSLPLTRFAPGTSSTSDAGITLAPTATLLKKGMPVAIVPGEPQDGLSWTAPISGRTSLDIEIDPRVDLDRLVFLINDSFRRKLDTQAYLKRIHGRVAGLIIAGDYEGCAILTWESAPQTARLVPYLDKFAVLQSSQGSAGVADIVFQAMVRTCFPDGVCWRSRSNNPVNKWYFERAAGTWELPDTQWTMFWTGEGVVEDQQKWNDYVAVCRGIVPTWLDGKTPD